MKTSLIILTMAVSLSLGVSQNAPAQTLLYDYGQTSINGDQGGPLTSTVSGYSIVARGYDFFPTNPTNIYGQNPNAGQLFGISTANAVVNGISGYVELDLSALAGLSPSNGVLRLDSLAAAVNAANTLFRVYTSATMGTLGGGTQIASGLVSGSSIVSVSVPVIPNFLAIWWQNSTPCGTACPLDVLSFQVDVVTPVPEPGTWLMLGSLLLVGGLVAKKKLVAV